MTEIGTKKKKRNDFRDLRERERTNFIPQLSFYTSFHTSPKQTHPTNKPKQTQPTKTKQNKPTQPTKTKQFAWT